MLTFYICSFTFRFYDIKLWNLIGNLKVFFSGLLKSIKLQMCQIASEFQHVSETKAFSKINFDHADINMQFWLK